MTNFGYITDNPNRIPNKTTFTGGDSFTQPIYNQTPFPDVLRNSFGMSVVNHGVSSSFMRDTAMRFIRDPSVVIPTDGFAVINSGINSPIRNGMDQVSRKSEIAALQALILLIAADRSQGMKREADSAVVSGQWGPWGDGLMSDGGAAVTTTPGSYVEWQNLPLGDYFGLGFTFREGSGGPQVNATSSTGLWTTRNGAYAPLQPRHDKPPMTALEQIGSGDSAQNLSPWPAMFPAREMGTSIRLTAAESVYTIVDTLYPVRITPPTIVIILPTRVTAASGYKLPDQTLRVVRGDMKWAVSDVVQRFTSLRGRVLVVDPDQWGWDPDIHTVADGLHPNNNGHALLADAVVNTIRAGEMLSAFMPSFGVSGPGFIYPTDGAK